MDPRGSSTAQVPGVLPDRPEAMPATPVSAATCWLGHSDHPLAAPPRWPHPIFLSSPCLTTRPRVENKTRPAPTRRESGGAMWWRSSEDCYGERGNHELPPTQTTINSDGLLLSIPSSFTFCESFPQ